MNNSKTKVVKKRSSDSSSDSEEECKRRLYDSSSDSEKPRHPYSKTLGELEEEEKGAQSREEFQQQWPKREYNLSFSGSDSQYPPQRDQAVLRALCPGSSTPEGWDGSQDPRQNAADVIFDSVPNDGQIAVQEGEASEEGDLIFEDSGSDPCDNNDSGSDPCDNNVENANNNVPPFSPKRRSRSLGSGETESLLKIKLEFKLGFSVVSE